MPPMKGLPLEFGIGVRGPKCLNDWATRWSKKFEDRFSRFDTIPAVTDSQLPSHVAIANTLYAKASSLKIIEKFTVDLFVRSVLYSWRFHGDVFMVLLRNTCLNCSFLRQLGHLVAVSDPLTATSSSCRQLNCLHVDGVLLLHQAQLCGTASPNDWSLAYLIAPVVTIISITVCAVAQHCYNGDVSFLWEKWKL